MPTSPPIPRRTPAPIVFTVGIFFALVGGAMLVAAGKLYVKQHEFLARAEHAAGTVVDFAESVETSSKQPYTRTRFFAPVFTFTDRAGVARRTTSKTSSGNQPGFVIGQTVPVLYDRGRPEDAELDTFFASWGGPTILGGMAVAFFAFGGALALSGLRTMLRKGGTQGPPGSGGGGEVPRDPAILSGR